ncbi:MAG TPA: hypothetical protein VM925_23085 [Labilithrix sp.]|nr:hypothetical protein [Labilithrix sp.]
MRSLKSRLFGCALAGVLGTFAAVGCSASGDTGDIIPMTGTGATEDSEGDVLPPSPTSTGTVATNPDAAAPGLDGGKKDASVKDASVKDAAKDATVTPPAPDPDTACTNLNEIYKRSCGKCGTEKAVCLADADGTGGTVSAYGACNNQKESGCIPGSTEEVACGNCGTQKRTCNNTCDWVTSACTGQPTSSCPAGSVQLDDVGCGANLYRQRSCKANCTWDNFSATCSAPPTFVNAPATVGTVNSTVAMLSSSVTLPKLTGTACPAGVGSATPYAFIEVRNPNPKAITASVYNSQAVNGVVMDTIIAAYEGTKIPSTETERKACKFGVGDSSASALTGNAAFASLTGAKAVTIPPNGSVQVYFAGYYATNAAGPILLNVKTETIAP